MIRFYGILQEIGLPLPCQGRFLLRVQSFGRARGSSIGPYDFAPVGAD